MNSKFNILILEDKLSQQKELKEAFNKKFDAKEYKIFTCSTVEELLKELSKRYYLGMSLDHKVPLTKEAISKMYDISIIKKLHKYHPLGYQSIYTAFPKWNNAKTFGSTIDYVSKKDTKPLEWASKFYETLSEYKINNIYNDAKEILFFPFGVLINDILKNNNNAKEYNKLFIFSIEMFCIILSALLEKEVTLTDIDKQLIFLKDNLIELQEKNTICSKELSKVLSEDFIVDMQQLYHKLQNREWNATTPECQDYITLLLLKLNFFSANIFATKVTTRLNYLRQKEVEVEKIENRAFITKEYITNFNNIPPNSNSSTYFIFRDYNGKSYFIDIGKYIKIDNEEIGSIKIYSKLSNRQIFPIGS